MKEFCFTFTLNVLAEALEIAVLDLITLLGKSLAEGMKQAKGIGWPIV